MTDKAYKRFAGQSVLNAGYHNFNWNLFHGGNELRDVSYASLAEAIADIGTAEKTLFITTKHRITKNTTIPENISIVVLKGGGFDVVVGKTLTILGSFSAGRFRVFWGTGTLDLSGAERFLPQWWGAKGDGVTDDTAAVQRCFDAAKIAGTVYFPPGNYLISDTIVVVGARHLNIRGDLACTNLNSDAATDRRIFWGSSVMTKPMFYFVGGSNVTWDSIVLDGKATTATTTFAHEGIRYDGAHIEMKHYDCKFRRMRIGTRICTGYDWDTGVWTPGRTAYDGVTDAGAASVGGFQCDNDAWINCQWDCYLAGVTIESAQALAMEFYKPHFHHGNVQTFTGGAATNGSPNVTGLSAGDVARMREGDAVRVSAGFPSASIYYQILSKPTTTSIQLGTDGAPVNATSSVACTVVLPAAYSVAVPAAQLVKLQGATLLGAGVAEVWTNQQSSTLIVIDDAHQEGGSEVVFENTASAATIDRFVFKSIQGGGFKLRGTGTARIIDSILTRIDTLSADVGLILENTKVNVLNKTLGLGNGERLEIMGGEVGNATNSWNAYKTVNLRGKAIITAIDGMTVNDQNDMSTVLGRYGYLPNLFLSGSMGAYPAGASFYAEGNNLIIGMGCYLNQAGTLIAGATSGSKFDVLAGTLRWSTFTGATIGGTPTMVTVFETTPTEQSITGNLKLIAAGNGIYIKEGANACMGVATLVGGTVVVSTTKVTANSRIIPSIQALGTVAAPKAIGVTARTAGTSFTITSADATDTSVIAWQIVEPT